MFEFLIHLISYHVSITINTISLSFSYAMRNYIKIISLLQFGEPIYPKLINGSFHIEIETNNNV